MFFLLCAFLFGSAAAVAFQMMVAYFILSGDGNFILVADKSNAEEKAKT